MSPTASSKTRKPPKKRKIFDVWTSDDEDDEDDEDFSFGSPVFPRPDNKDKKTVDAEKMSEEKPKRRSPRRSSFATLDGATSSPSMELLSSQGTRSATSPSHKSEEVILIEDELSATINNTAKEKQTTQNDRKRSCDSLLNIPTEYEPSSFTLNRVSTLPPRPSNKSKKKPTENTKKKKKPKTTVESALIDPQSASKVEGVSTASPSQRDKKKQNTSSTRETTASILENPSNNLSPTAKTKKSTHKAKMTPVKATALATAAEENFPGDKKAASTTIISKAKGKTVDSSSLGNDVSEGTKGALDANAASKAATQSSGTATNSNEGTSIEKPKKKKKKLNFQDQVFQHMFLGMKPFTLKSLAAALGQTDTALNYVMLSLTDKGLVVKKDFASSKGRTKTLYWAVDGVTAKEVAATNAATPAECKAAKQKLQNLQAEIASLRKTMADIQSDLSNEEVDDRLKEEEAARNELREKIAAIRSRMQSPPNATKPRMGLGLKVPPKKPATQDQLKRRINHMRDEWKQRKQKCMDFCDQLADAMEKKPKDVAKLLDVETDEMCGVTLPAKHRVETAAKKKR